MWAWPRWPTSGTSSTLPYGTSPRPSRCAASSSSPRRWPLALAVLAWIRQAQGEAVGALEAIGEAGLAAPGPDVPGLLNPVPAQRARLLLAQGDVAGAARWTQERGLGVGDEPDYPRSPSISCWARVLLAQDRPGPAFALLGRLHAAATSPGPHRQRHRDPGAAGAGPGARRAMRPPQWTAWPEPSCSAAPGAMSGCSPTKAWRWPRWLPAWSRRRRQATLPPAGSRSGCLAQLLRAFGEKPAAPGAAQAAKRGRVPGLVEQLTARELEILALLAAGTSNPRIAEQLVVRP